MEYQKHEYCMAVKCPQIVDGQPKNKELCQNVCEAWSFHNYLQRQGYKIIKAGAQ